jgi:hypothetical protein
MAMALKCQQSKRHRGHVCCQHWCKKIEFCTKSASTETKETSKSMWNRLPLISKRISTDHGYSVSRKWTLLFVELSSDLRCKPSQSGASQISYGCSLPGNQDAVLQSDEESATVLQSDEESDGVLRSDEESSEQEEEAATRKRKL